MCLSFVYATTTKLTKPVIFLSLHLERCYANQAFIRTLHLLICLLKY